MRFIKAKHIRVKDVVLFSEDVVSDLHASVVSIEKGLKKLHFWFRFTGENSRMEDFIVCEPDARCLLIRRPKKRQPVDDDARDSINTSIFLNDVSSKALGEITRLQLEDIRDRLREGTYPFSRLDRKTREKLLHVPTRWVRKGADWLLKARERHPTKK